MSVTIAGRSALQLAAMLASGGVDAEALARRTLDAIAACDDQAIFTRLTPERALREARAAAVRIGEGRPASVLDGVPIAWKDLFDLAGVTTTAGSRVLRNAVPAAQDAAVVARLAAAGMVCVGQANMTEFAYSGIGLNPHFGTPRNAHGRDVARIPGGSSSGSAVAVARGLVPVAIGSDTGGSVRIPAALNGIVGYKASSGRYPMDGVFPLSRTLDTLGVFAHTVADAALVDAALRGAIVPAARPAALAGLRIMVPTNVVLDDADAAVIANFDAALGRLADAGAIVERRHFAVFDEILALTVKHGAIAPAEAYALHRERLDSGADAEMDPRVVARLRLGADVAMTGYVTLLQERRRLIDAFVGGCLVAMPTVPHVAPPIAALQADDEQFLRANRAMLRNTALGNFLGWCGVSLPSGRDPNGMPTGLLLSGVPDSDDALLSYALSAERVVGRGDAAAPGRAT